jgi:hypothetical protein
MTLTGVLLGVINIAIVMAILLLLGAIIVWICSAMLSTVIPTNVQRGYMAVVALIGLYMLVALLLGIPTIHIIASAG